MEQQDHSIFCAMCRGAIAQSVERPTEVLGPGADVGSNPESDHLFSEIITPWHRSYERL